MRWAARKATSALRSRHPVCRIRADCCGHDSLATRASGPHPFPSRTRSLSLIAPMVLRARARGRVGRRRHHFTAPVTGSSDPRGGGCLFLRPGKTKHATYHALDDSEVTPLPHPLHAIERGPRVWRTRAKRSDGPAVYQLCRARPGPARTHRGAPWGNNRLWIVVHY